MKEQITATGRIVVQLLAVAAFVLLVGGCGLEAPQAPSWDTTLTVPLINRSYTSAELLEKLATDNIQIDENGNSSIQIQKQLDTVTIESILNLDPIESNYSKQIGRIKIVSPQDQQQNLAFADLVPLVAGEVPDTGITTTTQFGEASSFTHAEIDEGQITIRATNNTGFDLDSLSGRLVNQADGAVLAIFVVPGGLDDGAQYAQQYPLDDKSVGAQLDFELFFHTQGGPALSLADRAINLTIDYSDQVYVKSVYGKLDSFSNDYNQQTAIADDLKIETAMIANGVLNLQAQNSLTTPVTLTITLPEISMGGNALQLNCVLNAGGVLNQQVNLSGWTVEPALDSILTQIHAQVPGSDGNYVAIDADDEFAIDFALENIELASVRAIVPPTELAFENSTVAVDVPTGFDNISLDFVELNITINNYTELAGDVVLNLAASNGKALQVLGTIDSRNGNSVAISQIYSDQLADFLTPLPEEITVAGTVLVGDGVSTVDLSNNDYFSATAVISAPMAFKISQATVQGDKNELTVDSDISDGADRLNNGVFKASMRNHLPLGAQMRVYIGTDSASLFSAPLTILGPVTFAAATTDANGIVNQEITSESEVTLTSDQLNVFENSRLFIAPVLELSGSNGQTVRIRAADYFQINGVIEISARVGGEE